MIGWVALCVESSERTLLLLILCRMERIMPLLGRGRDLSLVLRCLQTFFFYLFRMPCGARNHIYIHVRRGPSKCHPVCQGVRDVL